MKPHAHRSYKPWTEEETNMLRVVVKSSETIEWGKIAAYMPGRTSKQCRERWNNYACDDINRAEWTPAEEKCMVAFHATHGPKWAKLAQQLPGRTQMNIRNRWHSLSRSKHTAHSKHATVLFTYIQALKSGMNTMDAYAVAVEGEGELVTGAASNTNTHCQCNEALDPQEGPKGTEAFPALSSTDLAELLDHPGQGSSPCSPRGTTATSSLATCPPGSLATSAAAISLTTCTSATTQPTPTAPGPGHIPSMEPNCTLPLMRNPIQPPTSTCTPKPETAAVYSAEHQASLTFLPPPTAQITVGDLNLQLAQATSVFQRPLSTYPTNALQSPPEPPLPLPLNSHSNPQSMSALQLRTNTNPPHPSPCQCLPPMMAAPSQSSNCLPAAFLPPPTSSPTHIRNTSLMLRSPPQTAPTQPPPQRHSADSTSCHAPSLHLAQPTMPAATNAPHQPHLPAPSHSGLPNTLSTHGGLPITSQTLRQRATYLSQLSHLHLQAATLLQAPGAQQPQQHSAPADWAATPTHPQLAPWGIATVAPTFAQGSHTQQWQQEPSFQVPGAAGIGRHPAPALQQAGPNSMQPSGWCGHLTMQQLHHQQPHQQPGQSFASYQGFGTQQCSPAGPYISATVQCPPPGEWGMQHFDVSSFGRRSASCSSDLAAMYSRWRCG